MSKMGLDEQIEVTDEIFEMAKELGYAIQRDRRFLDFTEAKERNDNDTNLQKLIGDFSIVRTKLNAQSMKEERDNDKVNELDREVTEMYEEIMSNKNMRDYSSAKAQMDELVRIASTIIELSANGMNPETALNTGCSPADCAGCSGC